MMFKFLGVNRGGAHTVGTFDAESCGVFVERCFVRRWQALTVTVAGEEVGGIVDHPDTGKRIWWAES